MPFVETETRYENTTMREIRNDAGDLTGYDIAPIEGYVLHNSSFDVHEYDPETNKQGELISMGYSSSSSSVEPEYNFDANPYGIYAVKRDAVGDDGIRY